jgi:hypothetical protein
VVLSPISHRVSIVVPIHHGHERTEDHRTKRLALALCTPRVAHQPQRTLKCIPCRVRTRCGRLSLGFFGGQLSLHSDSPSANAATAALGTVDQRSATLSIPRVWGRVRSHWQSQWAVNANRTTHPHVACAPALPAQVSAVTRWRRK